MGSIFVSESTVIAGNVTFGEDCNLWHNTIIRGDMAPVRVGNRVNIQDGALLHCQKDEPLEIGDDVVIGHFALVHGKQVGHRTLIGIRATILDGCETGDDCMIAACALLPPRTVVPDGSLVMGMPGKVVRPVSERERIYIRSIVEDYIQLANDHQAGKYHPYAGID
ncbi:MAG: gamma carbonic anhydrase family protein, partial [Phycisphaerales bacterium]|nr:gamma carbonic anhydrase family protein [Phycisphaerales bacterium]